MRLSFPMIEEALGTVVALATLVEVLAQLGFWFPWLTSPISFGALFRGRVVDMMTPTEHLPQAQEEDEYLSKDRRHLQPVHPQCGPRFKLVKSGFRSFLNLL